MSKVHTRFSDFVNSRIVEEDESEEIKEKSPKEQYMEKFNEKKNIRKSIQEYLDEVSCYSLADLTVEDGHVSVEFTKKPDCKEKESKDIVMERVCKMLSCSSWKYRPTEDSEHVYHFRY